MSLTTTANWVGSFLIAYFTPLLLAKIGKLVLPCPFSLFLGNSLTPGPDVGPLGLLV